MLTAKHTTADSKSNTEEYGNGTEDAGITIVPTVMLKSTVTPDGYHLMDIEGGCSLFK